MKLRYRASICLRYVNGNGEYFHDKVTASLLHQSLHTTSTARNPWTLTLEFFQILTPVASRATLVVATTTNSVGTTHVRSSSKSLLYRLESCNYKDSSPVIIHV